MQSNNAGLFIRYLAHLTDTLLFGTLLFLLALFFTGAPVENDVAAYVINLLTFLVVGGIFINIMGLVYRILLTNKYGGTLGRLAWGLRVLDSESESFISKKTSFFRFTVGYVFSTKFFGLGFWKIIKHPEKLGWHDELFNTKVVKKSNPMLGILILLLLIGSLGFLLYKNGTSVYGVYQEVIPNEVIERIIIPETLNQPETSLFDSF